MFVPIYCDVCSMSAFKTQLSGHLLGLGLTPSGLRHPLLLHPEYLVRPLT